MESNIRLEEAIKNEVRSKVIRRSQQLLMKRQEMEVQDAYEAYLNSIDEIMTKM